MFTDISLGQGMLTQQRFYQLFKLLTFFAFFAHDPSDQTYCPRWKGSLWHNRPHPLKCCLWFLEVTLAYCIGSDHLCFGCLQVVFLQKLFVSYCKQMLANFNRLTVRKMTFMIPLWKKTSITNLETRNWTEKRSVLSTYMLPYTS